ncbi:MAG: type II toxin-antitoxin system VapC family toxin [Anaerolineae bacterium]|nr:type II toxin-antitoxin system VapC family toxin [Anaerolineae bacterium]
MLYLLDTNTCIRYLNQRSASIIRRFMETPETEIVLCSVVRAELFTGALKSQYPERNLAVQQEFVNRFRSLPFDGTCELFYAQIRADLEKAGRIIGSNDLLIASIALANRLTVVSHNIREFSRVKNLSLIDWEMD